VFGEKIPEKNKNVLLEMTVFELKKDSDDPGN